MAQTSQLLIADPMPLDAYRPYVGEPDVGEEQTTAIKARYDAIALDLAACMAERGFDYWPDEYADTPVDSVGIAGPAFASLPVLPASREAAAESGYGRSAPADVSESEQASANRGYFAGLTASGQAAYNIALYGAESPDAPETEDGCAARAVAAHPEPPATERAQAAAKFWEDFGWLQQSMADLVFYGVMDSPDGVALNREWSACMASSGFDLDVDMPVLPSGPNPHYALVLALRTLPDGSLGESWLDYQGDEFTPSEERALLGSQPEIDIALADFDCRTSTNYEVRLVEIQRGLEQEFADQHKAELEQMAVAYQEATTG
ncbi:MAG: hypothetical protein LBG60_04045 [Bifidobacteriaceae bacterium]|nr:hypothetical protein [Bifidobacteriaceae bacterium]